MMKRSLPFMLLATALGAAALDSRAETARLALLAWAEVRGSTVRLADLLPTDAPQSLRAAAATVLAHSPEPGMTRNLAEREIVAALASSPGLLRGFAVPPVVTISRKFRYITAGEVLASLPAADARRIDAAMIRIPRVPIAADAVLQLRDIRHDAGASATYIRLQAVPADSRDGAGTLLMASIAGDFRLSNSVAPETEQRPEQLKPRVGFPVFRRAFAEERGPAAARMGERAVLSIELPGVRISRSVIPLRDGRLGETIPVREAGTGRTLRARVSGESQLQFIPAGPATQTTRGQ